AVKRAERLRQRDGVSVGILQNQGHGVRDEPPRRRRRNGFGVRVHQIFSPLGGGSGHGGACPGGAEWMAAPRAVPTGGGVPLPPKLVSSWVTLGPWKSQ